MARPERAGPDVAMPIGGSSAGRVLRVLLLFLLVALMLLLLFLTLRSLFFFASSGTDESASDDQTAPAAPEASASLQGDVSGVAGVSCGREPGAAADAPFQLDVVDPGATGAVVALDLVSDDGVRHPRQVSVAPGTDEGTVRVLVPDSGGGGGYVDCVITAIQRGQQVIFTGR